MHLPLRFAASLALRRKELLGVFVALEDILALVPTVQDAIYCLVLSIDDTVCLEE